MVDVLQTVEAHLTATLGEPDARAAVTFLGTDRIEVLRFLSGGPAAGRADGGREDVEGPVVRYVTLGMSAQPMTSGEALVADPVRGPRAELFLSLRPGRADTDKVLRTLAVLAASPQVEGVVLAPDASLDVGGPLWPAAPFTSVLVGEGGGLVPDLPLAEPMEPVRFLPLLPMTPNEAAWKRARGAAALRERWLGHGTDLRDPLRGGVELG
ncbi:suppressor of fused domain protein [Streptomyces sp. NPDC059740]|uniref:suppressor of fused domain protein n=1 Tax=Streptomyces sp. NPDC059740 TaxID=3346926 RepID=UPI00364AD76C